MVNQEVDLVVDLLKILDDSYPSMKLVFRAYPNCLDHGLYKALVEQPNIIFENFDINLIILSRPAWARSTEIIEGNAM